MTSSSSNVAYVWGANGISGTAMIDILAKQSRNEWSQIICISRRPTQLDVDDNRIYFISIDILKALLKFRVSFNLHIMGFYMGAIILMGYFSGFEPMKLIEGLWIGYMLAEISIIIIAFVYLCFLVNWKIEINKICLNKLRRNLNKT